MIALHLDWSSGRPALWAEGPMRSSAPPGFAPGTLSMRSLLECARKVMWYPDGFTGGSPIAVKLPFAGGKWLASWDCASSAGPLAEAKAESISPSIANLAMFLSDVKEGPLVPGVFPAEDVRRAAGLMRFAAALASRGRYLPAVEFAPSGEPLARWRPAPDAADERRLRTVAPSGADRAFVALMLDGIVRLSAMTALSRRIAPAERFETFHDAWLAALRSESPEVPLAQIRSGSPSDAAELAARLEDWSASLRESPETRAALAFSLVPPAGADGAWRVTLPRLPSGRGELLALGQATLVFPPLRSFRAGGDGTFAAELSRAEAETFVRSAAAALRAAGYEASVPEGLVGEHVTAAAEAEAGEAPGEGKAAQALRARLVIRVDGEAVTEEEIAFLLDQNSPLVFFRDRWIEVDRNVLKEALKALREANGRKLKLQDAVRFAFGCGRVGRLRVRELAAHGWLRGLLNELSGEERFAPLPPPKGFVGQLRPFQARGYSWLAFLARWGFGACLADDMGLGKTVQAIALILRLFEEAPEKGRPVLVVAPLTVIGNWKRELSSFAPGLKVMVHHGASRDPGGLFAASAARADVVLTSYTLLVRDFGPIAAAAFRAVVLDEAQAIKNPDTRVSRAVRALDAPVRVALTGTPLENSVNDLWAIEDFLNPGFLGERQDFITEYSRPIAADPRGGAMKRLKRSLAPFVLRRLKSDPGVAASLGEKREVREYCPITSEQRLLYERALHDFRADAGLAGSSRRGRIFALITELKEICDSPELLRLRSDAAAALSPAALAGGSGKVRRLDELLEEIYANGESALVFTQYARMGRLLKDHLLEHFGRPVPFLHGALDPKRREAEIAAFNRAKEPSAFVLSLKAGGFGLNLTRATHVIHFDRWWNPAVEAQATDRAHRIGQTRNVEVHVFVCSGTVEDRVDRLLESKKILAEGAIASGEGFLASMADDELSEFLELSAEETVDVV